MLNALLRAHGAMPWLYCACSCVCVRVCVCVSVCVCVCVPDLLEVVLDSHCHPFQQHLHQKDPTEHSVGNAQRLVPRRTPVSVNLQQGHTLAHIVKRSLTHTALHHVDHTHSRKGAVRRLMHALAAVHACVYVPCT